MKDVHDWISVKRMFKSGVKINQIAKRMKISRNTVKKLLKQNSEPQYKRTQTSTKVDLYKDNIKAWFVEEGFIGTRIYEELIKIGYKGSINPIYRYLKTLKDEKNKISKKATDRVETPPGDQAQFDWSPYTMVIGNEIRRVICFSMILSYSRQKSMVFSLSEDADAIYEAIQELFEDLGGITAELVIDNPKALVIENIPDSEPKFNFDALRLATHIGTELNPCNCYRARTKGKIEKPYQYIEAHFIKGNSFPSMTELNKASKEFITNWCQKVHGTTKRIPSEAHKEEIICLSPIPEKRFIKGTLEKRKVSPDSYVNIDARKYSVPVKYVDKQVQYRIVYGYKIEIYDMNMNFIRSYEINTSDDPVTRLDEDYEPISNKAPKSIPEVRRQFKSAFKNGEIFLETASKILDQPIYHARQILKLRELYTTESLDKILEYCIRNNILDIDGVKGVLKEKYVEIVLEDKVSQATNPIAGGHSLARDLSYYEGGGQN
ncbi:MAG: IS21 family transposase [Bacillota bacterium]|nr:IS21 family transposase [Bacillota bacterium]